MNKILLISDDDLISLLYRTNLEVYLGAEVYLASEINSAQKLLDEVSFNLLITFSLIKEDDSTIGMIKKLFSGPIIAIGESVDQENIIEIKSYYNIQKIVKTSAKLLGVTAREMANKVMPSYYSLDLKFLKHIKRTPADIFIEMNNNEQKEYTLVVRSDNDIQFILSQLQNQGIDKIYVNSNDRLLMINTISIAICESFTISSLVDNAYKSNLIEESMEFASKNMFSDEVAEELVNLSISCSKTMKEIVDDTPNLSALINLFQQNKNGYGHMHSMIAAYISAHIVKNISWGGESHIEKLNFVLFFHDIVLAPIFLKFPDICCEDELLFNSNLTESEKDLVLNHARIAGELVSSFKKCPIGVDLLIKQHHGMNNGVGFAIEYRDDISPLSKIIIISEAFVEELFKEQDIINKRINVEEIKQVLNTKFNKHTYKKIIETLSSLKV